MKPNRTGTKSPPRSTSSRSGNRSRPRPTIGAPDGMRPTIGPRPKLRADRPAGRPTRRAAAGLGAAACARPRSAAPATSADGAGRRGRTAAVRQLPGGELVVGRRRRRRAPGLGADASRHDGGRRSGLRVPVRAGVHLPLLPWISSLVGADAVAGVGDDVRVFPGLFGLCAVMVRRLPGWPIWFALVWAAPGVVEVDFSVRRLSLGVGGIRSNARAVAAVGPARWRCAALSGGHAGGVQRDRDRAGDREVVEGR